MLPTLTASHAAHNQKWSDDGTCFNDCQEVSEAVYTTLEECCEANFNPVTNEIMYFKCMQATHSPSSSPTQAVSVSLLQLFLRNLVDCDVI